MSPERIVNIFHMPIKVLVTKLDVKLSGNNLHSNVLQLLYSYLYLFDKDKLLSLLENAALENSLNCLLLSMKYPYSFHL